VRSVDSGSPNGSLLTTRPRLYHRVRTF
jgi:hypothetical protein